MSSWYKARQLNSASLTAAGTRLRSMTEAHSHVIYLDRSFRGDMGNRKEKCGAAYHKVRGQPMDHITIHKLHATVLGLDKEVGYRQGRGAPRICNSRTVRFLPPDSECYCIEGEVEALLVHYHQGASAIERAANLHYGFVKIHPFDDGNGRVARVLALWVLHDHGYKNLSYEQFEKYIEIHRAGYDNSLDDGQLMYVGYKDAPRSFVDFLEGFLLNQKRK
ncbi:Fic family protein [Candidatus Babeliales bacterium]|nr:Fic family protein [Candidatus Babeliales bacterium]